MAAQLIPSEEEARQFAIMLQAGLPAAEAITYFIDSDDPSELALALSKWLRSRAVKRAMTSLMRKPWQDLTLEERIHVALDQHYANLAYLLYTRHYIDANQGEKAKLDSARQALEAKVAGTAGKGDALSRFFDDLKAGTIKLTPRVVPS